MATKKAYRETFENYKSLRKQVLQIQKNNQENQARIEMLEYQISEIEAAALSLDEDVQLEQERQRLLNHKMIADTLSNAYRYVGRRRLFPVFSNVRSAMNDLQGIEEYDAEYKTLSDQMAETYYTLEDLTKRLEDLVDWLGL